MTVLINTAEGLANNTTIPTDASNTGGASGNAFTEALVAGTGFIKSSNAHPAHNSMGYQLFANAGTDKARLRWDFGATNTASSRFYWLWNSLPGIAQTFFTFIDTAFSGMANLVCSSAGVLQMSSKTGTVKSFAAMSTLTMYRFEVAVEKVTGGTTDGKFKCSYFLGDSTSAIDSFEVTNTNVGANQVLRTYYGGNAAGSKIDAFADSFKADNTQYAYLGPGAPAASPPTLSLFSYTDYITVKVTGTAGAGGALTYSVTPSATATLGPDIFIMPRNPSNGADYTATFRVDEAGSGLFATQTLVIPKMVDPTQVNIMAPRTPAGIPPSNVWN